MKRPGGRWAPLAAALPLAVGLGACGTNVAATQAPAVVSGTVTASPSCSPGTACSRLVALVPGAAVEAVGQSGTLRARADHRGHYRISLLEGTYLVEAARAPGDKPSGGVQVDLAPAQTRTVNLRISG